jgi:hypothetical protein
MKGDEMKKMLFGVFAMLAFSGWCGRTNDSIHITNPISAEERAHMELIGRVYQKLPHSDTVYTLGRLVKMCDTVAIVRVTKVEGVDNIPDHRLSVRIAVTYSAERVIFGTPRKEEETVRFSWLDRRKRPLPCKGDRWLAFICDDDQSINIFIAGDWRFNKAEHPVKGYESPIFVAPAVIGESLGVITLDGGERERGILAAVDDFLLNLRGGDRDQERYYACLLRLLRSPVQRVSDDAQHDLLNFIRYDPSFDTNRILADDNIPEGIKDYVRLILIPDREKKRIAEGKGL